MEYFIVHSCGGCGEEVSKREELTSSEFREAKELGFGKIEDNLYILTGRVCEECGVKNGGIVLGEN